MTPRLFALSAIALLATISGRAEKAITVCDLFADLQRHADEVITVEGILVGGEEVFALIGDRCVSVFRTGDFIWPTAISLKTSGTRSTNSRGTGTDFKSMDVLNQAAERASSVPGARVRCVIEGDLHVRREYVTVNTPAGPRHHGFGHLNSYPAELVIRRVLGARVLQ